MIKLDESFFFLFLFLFITLPLAALTLSHFFHWWLLAMLPAAWQEFAWHANELCVQLCIMILVSVVSLPASACVCVCHVCGTAFTPSPCCSQEKPQLLIPLHGLLLTVHPTRVLL